MKHTVRRVVRRIPKIGARPGDFLTLNPELDRLLLGRYVSGGQAEFHKLQPYLEADASLAGTLQRQVDSLVAELVSRGIPLPSEVTE